MMIRASLVIASVSVVCLAVLQAACGGDGESRPSDDEGQIRQVSQLFIDYSKEERWSEIYDLYSREFRERCDEGEFLAGFVMAKVFLGGGEWEDALAELQLVSVEEIKVEGATATAMVTVRGPDNDAHGEPAWFVKEQGAWHIAPDPGTEGCGTVSFSADVPDCDQPTLWRGLEDEPLPPDFGGGSQSMLEVAPDPVARGETVRATYYTTRRERCEIDVGLPVSASQQEDLRPQTVGQSGQVSWAWRIPIDATPGVSEVTVSCDCRTSKSSWFEELSGNAIGQTYEIR